MSDNPTVLLETSSGDILVELFADKANHGGRGLDLDGDVHAGREVDAGVERAAASPVGRAEASATPQ